MSSPPSRILQNCCRLGGDWTRGFTVVPSVFVISDWSKSVAQVKHIVGSLANHVAHLLSQFAQIFTKVESVVDDFVASLFVFEILSRVVFYSICRTTSCVCDTSFCTEIINWFCTSISCISNSLWAYCCFFWEGRASFTTFISYWSSIWVCSENFKSWGTLFAIGITVFDAV